MELQVSTGWMRLALRAQICAQCDPKPTHTNSCQLLDSRPCEIDCALFRQLPRLARFLKRHRAKPPLGYEEFAVKLLCERSLEKMGQPNPFLDHIPEALATLEKVASLLDVSPAVLPQHDCLRRELALGQMSVCSEKSVINEPA